MKLALAILGTLLAIAWLIDWFQFRRERRMARDQRHQWWKEPGDPPEGDY